MAKQHEKATEFTILRAKQGFKPAPVVNHTPRPPNEMERQKGHNFTELLPSNNNNQDRSQILDQRRAKGLCIYCGEK